MNRTRRSIRFAVRQAVRRGINQKQVLSALLTTGVLVSGAVPALAADASSAAPADQQQPGTGDQQPSTKPASKEELEEVVVRSFRLQPTTATGIPMTLVETPQAISVVSPEEFKATGTDNIYDALELVPGADQQGQGYGRDNLELRGIPLTEMRVNGIPFDLQTTLEADAFERVEVVRGPATALYGISGSFGGEINNILKRPQDTFGATLQAKYGSFGLDRYTADITGPVPDTDGRLQARFVGMYTDWSTPIDVVPIHDYKHMLFGALSYQFTDATQATLYYYDSFQHMDPTDGAPAVYNNGQLGLPPVPWSNYYFSSRNESTGGVSYKFIVAELDHALTNGWDLKTQATEQQGEFNASYYYPFGPAGAYGLPKDEAPLYTFDAVRHYDRVTFDESLGGKFDLFGRTHDFFAQFEYHGDLHPYNQQVLKSVGVGLINIFTAGEGVLADGQPIPAVDRSTLPVANSFHDIERQYRGDVQLLLNPMDRLHILTGALFEKGNYEEHSLVGEGGSLRDSYSQLLGRVNVTYDLIKDRGIFSAADIYASWNEGFNPNIGVLGTNNQFLNSTQVMRQYETGFKTEMFDGRLASSITAYRSSITNIPVAASYFGVAFTGYSVLAGTEHVRGIEYELVGRIVGGWNVIANYTNCSTAIFDPNYPTLNVQAQGVPHQQAGLFTTYEWVAGPLAGLRLGGGIFAKSQYPLTGNPATIANLGNLDNPGYARVDLSASYKWTARLELFANVQNVGDKGYFMAWTTTPAYEIVRGQPRTFEGGFRYSFK